MSEQAASWRDIGTVGQLASIIEAAALNAARGLTDMVGRDIATGTVQARVVGLDEATSQVGDPASEMACVHLLLEGNLTGQSMLILPVDSALNLTDMLMDAPLGTSTSLGDLERSALAEVGNVIVSYFLNSIASLTGESLRPSPPAVLVDVPKEIISAAVTPVTVSDSDLLILETAFSDPDGLIQASFWVLPDMAIAV